MTVYLSHKDRRMIDDELRSLTHFFIEGLKSIDAARKTLEDCEDANEAKAILVKVKRKITKLRNDIMEFGD